MQIVLYKPQIPQNTGNIARTCAVTGTSLKIMGPCGFSIEEKQLKRAGLDYWHLVDLTYIYEIDSWLEEESENSFFFSSQADQNHTQVCYSSQSRLIFGNETEGLPREWRIRWPNRFVRLPMLDLKEARCLNLATSVGIALYESLRQTGFKDLHPPSDHIS